MFRGALIFPALVFLVLQTRGQLTDTYWKYFSREDGLAGSWVRCLAEDSLGYLWIGTQSGLSRFDGTHFQNYFHDDRDPTSLISNFISSIRVLPDGRLLVGTLYGLSLFDPGTQTSRNYYLDFDSANPDALNNIYGFQYWPDQTVWIATHAGVVEWSMKTDHFAFLDDSFNVSRTGVGSPFLDHPTENGCWINMSDGWVYYDRTTGSKTQLPTGIPGKTYPRNDRVFETRSLDARGRIWYGTYQDSSLFCFDPSTNTERRYPFLLRKGERTLQNSSIQILCDATGRVWVSSWSEFLQRLDEGSGTFYRENIRNNDRLLMPEVSVYSMLETRAGDLIFGTFNGLVIHTRSMDSATLLELPKSETSDNPNQFHVLSQLAHPHSGDHFTGTWGAGLYWYHADRATFTQHKVSDSDYGSGIVNDLLWWKGKVICATQKGVYSFDPKSQAFSPFPEGNPEVNQAPIFSMELSKSYLWLSQNNGVLYKYQPETGTLKKFVHQEKTSGSIPSNYAVFMRSDDSGGIWYAYHGGIGRIDEESGVYEDHTPFTESHFNGNTNVAGLLRDRAGNLWYSTSLVGLYRKAPDEPSFKRFAYPKQLGTNCPIPLAEDETGDVWFYTEAGLHYVHPGDTTFHAYNVEPNAALGMHFSHGAACDGHVIVLGGTSGLVSINTQLRPALIPIVSPLISAIDLGEQTMPISGQTITLSSDQDLFTIFFSSPSETGRSGLEYEVMMEPLWSNWVSVSGRTSTTFNNVPGGEYTFRVRVRDAYGVWVESLPLSIIIEKKFTETRGFRIFLVLLFAYLIYLAFSLYRRRSRAKLHDSVLRRFIAEKHSTTPEQLAMEMIRITTDVYRIQPVALVAISEVDPEWLAKSHDWLDQYSAVVNRTIKSQEAYYHGYPACPGFEFYPLIHQGTTLAYLISASEGRATESHVQSLCNAGASKLAAALAEREIEEKERMLGQVRNLLSESQLVSLRAQMNPHFVFNCLNSIQESILLKHYAEASLYLNKFSKLFRQVLQNSSRNLITLREEIEVLTLYLELEHMRFQRSFDFTIECDDDLDTEEIMIPSMLIQPFVENALWHGLMHKEGDRRLAIRFYPKNDDIFIVEVDDNGIGREKATAIRREKSIPGAHQSKGISISTERLRLIHMEQDQHATVEIIDKKTPTGEPLGTRVIFELSLFLN